MKVLFKTESFSFEVALNDSLTAREIFDSLPIKSVVSTWGDEIYFDIGFKASAQGSTMEVIYGDVAYWPQGKCLCIFFGPTPASTGPVPVPASPVVIVGKTTASSQELRKIKLGEKISIEKI
ncbi:MAG: cyclophilin-like fold protein [Candidatus Omnitrophica bacterium]|nr:cyclophilin-like fold protein [Candidatus Omnitrophota bacterium]MDD5430279.1 cyclophilin-like fold protein [Candidatus Omnitrophota bacterium]